MKQLKDVIAAFRREMRAALMEDPTLTAENRLEPERVVLTLQVDLVEKADESDPKFLSLCLLDSAPHAAGSSPPAQRGHSLTIEFLCGAQSNNGQVSKPKTKQGNSLPRQPSRELHGTDADGVAAALERVLGAPGFDSSARATVFIEALEGLSDDQVRAVLARLDAAPAGGATKSDKRVRHHLSNVVRSGPLKSLKSAREILEEVFQNHLASAVLQLLKARWKSQEEWNAES